MTTTTRLRVLRSPLLIVAAMLAVAVALALAFTGGAAADHEPIHGVPLTTPGHNEFTDDVAVQVRDQPGGRPAQVVNLRDASNIAVFEFTIQPGAWFPWHTHPGPVLAAVAQGDLVFIYADDCLERPYDAGEAFVDPGVVHTAYNPSETEVTVVIATVLGVAAGASPATPIDPDEATALNATCGTDAPVPQGSSHH
jgi:quercetin dioxygenase-like cupin family protein